MSYLSIFLTALGLSMDAFAVSLTIGMGSTKKTKFQYALKACVFFGLFQGLMPVIGFFLGASFAKYVASISGIIAFVLLGFIGGKMIIEAFKKQDDEVKTDYTILSFLLMAIATSIDALAVGLSFAFLNVNIIWAALIITLTTGILSFIAVYIGKGCSRIIGNKSEIIGGIILLLIGLKLLLNK